MNRIAIIITILLGAVTAKACYTSEIKQLDIMFPRSVVTCNGNFYDVTFKNGNVCKLPKKEVTIINSELSDRTIEFVTEC